jgi:CheY-like chemotaxis protein
MDKATILFVDDDRDFLDAQQAWFGAKGFRVVTADTGEAAVQAARSARPDIIFLDLMMEHYDSGFTLGRRLRGDPALSAVPIIMLSGVAAATGQGFAEQAEELRRWSRIDGFVDKPVTSQQLLRVVERALQG